ncbi:MAG: methyltransferase domain-containing protein [Candidatus Levybacteria bacterium]|nr:methyltransferase domain-containing protein [Candidatus Levybacteria bacterium]
MSLVFKILVYIYSFISFFERKVFVKNIKREDLVLDVGSGDKPFWRADVIVDKYLQDDQQRHSGAMLYDSRKVFVKADVENLPFKDKVFDFVFCSHLLEHVKNPDKAIRELTRVAKRGYIEVPNAILDLLQPFPPHLWFPFYKEGKLTFVQKEKEKNFYVEVVEQFGKIFYINSLFKFLMAVNLKQVFIMLYWNDKVNFGVKRVTEPYVYIFRKENHKKGVYEKLSFIFYRLFYKIVTLFYYNEKKIEVKQLLK